MNSGCSNDSESNGSSIQGEVEDKNIIDKILGEMKSQFNKTERKLSTNSSSDVVDKVEKDTFITDTDTTDNKSSLILNKVEQKIVDDGEEKLDKTEDNSTNDNNGGIEADGNKQLQQQQEQEENQQQSDTKPRIVLLFKKPTTETPTKSNKTNDSSRRSLRNKNSTDEKVEETTLKRSTRRRSKDCTESVLQSAIARKEKSYNESNKPQRLTRQLKPTQKILENLALAKQEKSNKIKPIKNEKNNKSTNQTNCNNNNNFNNNNNSSSTENETQTNDENTGSTNGKKHKNQHKSRKSASKRLKTGHLYNENSREESDSDQSVEEKKINDDCAGFRRSRRISANKLKDESMDGDELIDTNDQSTFNGESNDAELISYRLCLCTQKTKYYAAQNDGEINYCGAVDSIGDKSVGCSKVVDVNSTMMLRPSTKIPYTLYCESHKHRLLRHNCCPTCGLFCTQGEFLECEAKHQYHKDCQIFVGNSECCPHCGNSNVPTAVTISMHSSKKPVFLPVQKSQYITAKMTFQPNYHQNDNDELKCNTPPLIPIGVLDILNTFDSLENDLKYDINDLILAIKDNSLEKLAAMLGAKTIDIATKIPEFNDGTLLHLAAESGFLPAVHMLIVAGLQPDVFDKEQNTPLMLAVLSGKNDVVQYLIKAGSSIDLKGTDGMTALHLAAKCGNIKACELLLKASTHIKNYVNSLDDGGWTPLVWACEHGYANVANFLIYKGADPHIRDVEHNVALHWAAFSGSSHIAELLLNKGCEINAINAHGDTPLHIGARQDMYNCVLVLLARGADVSLINKNNELPMDCVPPDGNCYGPLALNTTLQGLPEYECQSLVLSNDISKGKETNPIQCYNSVDNKPKPTDFIYITKSCITMDDVKIDNKISSMQSCSCEERCVEDDCLCGDLSVRCWYDKEGKLISDFNFTDIPMIFECNDGCTCNAITCNNRVVQKGLNHRFEVFKTNDKGWGVRTLRLIPKGSFVCEYVGEIITDLEAERRDDDSFLFDLENRVCKSISDADIYCIDAKFYGNFARFINHSCNPNLTSVKVFIDHQDLRFPRIAFFANRDIQASEELSFDYGEKFWMAKYKTLSCRCGYLECKYSSDAIDNTVQNYQRRLLEECG